MAAKPRAQHLIADFPGLQENVDPIDQPQGASEAQVNACSIRIGELTIRHGLRPVTFETE